MKEYNVDVLFKDGYILNMPKELVSNDFNSTKLNLTFDIEGRVLFKMLFPDKETFIVDEVKDNTIIFKEGYLSQEGIYLIEFAIYDETGRLTNNAISEISVRRELVSTNDIVEIDDRVPILDGLIRDVNEAIEKVSNIESGDGTGTGSINYTLPIASANTLGGIKVGANLTIEPDGTLNAAVSSSEGETKNENIEPLSDDIPKVFINGSIPTDKTELEAELTYMSKTEEFHSYIKIKCQGTSSMSYPKKNFTVKLYSDEERSTKLKKDFRGWGEQNKFCLKANYIDHSHSRNIVSANLWTEVVNSRSDYDSLPEELRTSPRNGAIDGFPIKVYNNGTYQGIYTWNIPKDDWLYNMDSDNTNHALLCAETNTDGTYRENACNFRKLWSGVDENDWSIEVGTNSEALKTSLNNLISCVKDTDDETFKATIGNYLDVQSAIDYYLHQYVICGLDGLAKNMLLATYDGTKWYCGAYDMDSTFGLWWNGTSFVATTYKCPEQYQEQFSLLWERIELLYVDELKARYNELRSSVYSLENMFTKFERFTDLIGKDLYEEDITIYTAIPSQATNNITQIRNYIRDRLTYVDGEIEALIEPIYCTSITLNTNTLEFTSTDNQTLVATVEPSNTNETIKWTSDNEDIAIVTDGTVKPKTNGSCIITATCGSQSATCNVTITGIGEEQSGLPEEYQQVDYLESTSNNYNTNYIATGIYPTHNTAIEIKAQDIEHGHSFDKWYGSSSLFRAERSSNDKLVISFSKTAETHTLDIDGIVTIKQDKADLYLNGEFIQTYSYTEFAEENELRLFSIGNGDRDGQLRIFYCKIWEDDVLVREFIPCYRKADNVAGMYDLVNDKFYTNGGTIDFVTPISITGNETIVAENFESNGKKFRYSLSGFNWETDSLEASFDVTNTGSGDITLLTVGNSLNTWGMTGYHINLYGGNIVASCLTGAMASNKVTVTPTDKTNIIVNISKQGVLIDGTLIEGTGENADFWTTIKTLLAEIPNLSIGAVYGGLGNTKYNYIKVIRNSN